MQKDQRIEVKRLTFRDEKGRLLPGHPGLPGAGRPKQAYRALPFAQIVGEYGEREGLSMHEALWEVAQALFSAARKGDVTAAKLLIDKLCENDEEPMQLNIAHELSDTERAHRLEQLLHRASQRRREVEELCG